MRSWVLVLLLALLPLQSALATIFVYCKHEAKAEAGHVGHHEHQHEDAVADIADAVPDQQPTGSQQLDDNDCGFCHLSSAQPLGVSVEPWTEGTAHVLVSSVQVRLTSRALDSPERPNWSRLARSASHREGRST